MKQDIENIIKKNLPETRYELGGYPEEGYYIEVSEDGEYIKSDEINTSLIADEVLKAVVDMIKTRNDNIKIKLESVYKIGDFKIKGMIEMINNIDVFLDSLLFNENK